MSKIKYLYPLIFFVSYILVTFLMYLVSPWRWPASNKLVLIVFIFSIIAAMVFGYISGWNRGIKKSNFKGYSLLVSPVKLLNISIFFNFVFLYPKILFVLKQESIGITEFFTRVLVGLTNPAISYAEKHLVDNPFTSLANPMMLSYVLSKPIMALAFPLAVVFWGSISRIQKIAILFIVAIDVLSFIAIGTNKGIFDYVLVLPFLIYLKRLQSIKCEQTSGSQRAVKAKSNKLIFLSAIAFVILSLAYFSSGNLDRKRDYFLYEPSTGVSVDVDTGVLSYLPTALIYPYVSLDNYLTQGYYALELSLAMDFSWTYGLGHSFFTTTIGEKFLGEGAISERTYQHRLEEIYGYSHYGKWHSFFVWFANDLTFFGVIGLIFILFSIFGTLWARSTREFDPLSITLLTYMVIMFFYFPANNQVLGFMGTQISFFILFFLWLFSRKRIVL